MCYAIHMPREACRISFESTIPAGVESLRIINILSKYVLAANLVFCHVPSRR